MLIRLAGPEDFEAVGNLTVAAYRGDGQTYPGHPYEPRLSDAAGRAPAGDLLVCVDDASGEVLGSVLFVLAGSEYAELSAEGEAEFRMLAVSPGAQGRGVGEALARACLDRAKQLGCHAVTICVNEVSEPAQRLYARMGFHRVPELDWNPLPEVRLLGLRYTF